MPIPEESTMEDLKPCPFCGSELIESLWHGVGVPSADDCGYWVTGCIACSVFFFGDDKQTTDQQWNTRAHP